VIFVTVGTQLPFPRLVAAMDGLAPRLGERVVAQTGPDPGPYPNIETHSTLAPDLFSELFSYARVVVAHAGIGTVLAARQHRKPLILMPRYHYLAEHRNDHQVATVKALKSRAGLYLAWDETDLAELLTRRGRLISMTDAPSAETAALVGFISDWLA
jgi:UDP-N-acetylglucosamine transferase subunit ALG13